MSKNIIVTFASRAQNMPILSDYVNEIIKKRIVDEWHIWDFTNSELDKNIVKKYGELRYIGGQANYQYYKDIELNSTIQLPVKIPANLYIALVPDDGEHFMEVLIGGWNNGQTIVRNLHKNDLNTYNRNPDEKNFIFKEVTPGVLSNSINNNLRIKRDSTGITTIEVDEYSFKIPEEYTKHQKFSVYMRSNFETFIELGDATAKVKRFVGNIGEKKPAFQAYQYYSSQYNTYKNDVFIKCDDEVVYIELNKLKDFIKFVKTKPEYFIVSANIINDATFAYLQQKNGSIPTNIGRFEEPTIEGVSSLSEDGEKAEKLHQFFLDRNALSLPLEKKVTVLDTVYSTNFVAWRGEKLRYMFVPERSDDQVLLTKIIPQYLNKKTAIYSDLMVSRLASSEQEKTMDVEKIVAGYTQIKKSKYRI